MWFEWLHHINKLPVHSMPLIAGLALAGVLVVVVAAAIAFRMRNASRPKDTIPAGTEGSVKDAATVPPRSI